MKRLLNTEIQELSYNVDKLLECEKSVEKSN